MVNNRNATIKEIVEYGLENIPKEQTITINAKDFMYVYRVLQEYMRFLHNPDHYQDIDDVKDFLGTVSSGGGFEVLDNALYKKIPKGIKDMEMNGDFEHSLFPKYYNVKE